MPVTRKGWANLKIYLKMIEKFKKYASFVRQLSEGGLTEEQALLQPSQELITLLEEIKGYALTGMLTEEKLTYDNLQSGQYYWGVYHDGTHRFVSVDGSNKPSVHQDGRRNRVDEDEFEYYKYIPSKGLRREYDREKKYLK